MIPEKESLFLSVLSKMKEKHHVNSSFTSKQESDKENRCQILECPFSSEGVTVRDRARRDHRELEGLGFFHML